MTEPEDRDRGLALVTGASSGIGEALARVFAERGHALILTGRSQSRLDRIADEIAAEHGERPHVLVHDLAAPGAARVLADDIAARGLKPRYLVNSAGLGLFGRAERLGPEDQAMLIDLNCRALTELTLVLLPDAIEQRGGVLNVGSVGGFFPGPGMAVYFATKAYVQSFSQGLRAEYCDGRLNVTALCPGPVVTRFQGRARMVSPKVPAVLDHDLRGIARAGYRGLMRNRAVVTPGFVNALMVWLSGLIFHRACIPFVRAFHFRRNERERAARSANNSLPQAGMTRARRR
ncbi:MAG: SDR family NAD(P)-dependent oxidoreductase [Pseudolabrys sp.]